jgi:hypothetical protein
MSNARAMAHDDLLCSSLLTLRRAHGHKYLDGSDQRLVGLGLKKDFRVQRWMTEFGRSYQPHARRMSP